MMRKIVFLLVVVLTLTISITTAFAYNVSDAVDYSDDWALDRNPNWPNFWLHGDCANFVSQCLYAGGIPFDTLGSISDKECWWCEEDPYSSGGWDYTSTWSVAPDLWDWLIHDNHGSYIGSWGPSEQSNSNASIEPGDVILYDWDSDASKDHTSFVAAWGTDPDSGYVGDLINQHTSDRYHAIWHLKPYNDYASTTFTYAARPD